MLYRDLAAYEGEKPALQVISAKKAQGTKTEVLNAGADNMKENIAEDNSNITPNKYYSGEIVYRDFEAGDVKTKTQMDFVKMLIGII